MNVFLVVKLLLCISPKHFTSYVWVVYIQSLILSAVLPNQSCSKFHTYSITCFYHVSLFRNASFSGFNLKSYLNYIRPLIQCQQDSKLLIFIRKLNEWLKTIETFYFSTEGRSFDFSLLSYNILAQELLEKNSFLYDWSDLQVLTWEYRRQILLNEIKQFNADVSKIYILRTNYNHSYGSCNYK